MGTNYRVELRTTITHNTGLFLYKSKVLFRRKNIFITSGVLLEVRLVKEERHTKGNVSGSL